MTQTKTVREVLGVRPAATQEEIRSAWRRFAVQHHPDRGGDPEVFEAGADAYRRLTGHRPLSESADVVFYRRPRGFQVPVAWGRSRFRRFRRPKRVIARVEGERK